MDGLALIGGRAVLDFLNTEGGARNGPPERIGSYLDLIAWLRFAQVVDAALAGRLERRGRERPVEAVAVFERAIELREALFRIFHSAAVEDREPAAADWEVLDRELAAAWSMRRLVPESGRFEWRFEAEETRLDSPLWRIVEDAADLLSSSGDLSRVKVCGGDDCSWLFLDESRNRSRRWCEMGDCGNRAKARRYRERHG